MSGALLAGFFEVYI